MHTLTPTAISEYFRSQPCFPSPPLTPPWTFSAVNATQNDFTINQPSNSQSKRTRTRKREEISLLRPRTVARIIIQSSERSLLA